MSNSQYPVWRFHKEQPGKIVYSAQEDQDLGPGWVSSPTEFDQEPKQEEPPAMPPQEPSPEQPSPEQPIEPETSAPSNEDKKIEPPAMPEKKKKGRK